MNIFEVVGTPLQEWLEPPKNTTVPEGRDAVLACRVKNKVADPPAGVFLSFVLKHNKWTNENQEYR